MLGLLLVEDESLDREGMKTFLSGLDLGISRIKAARSGFEALEIVKDFTPDILVTDIKMPGISGLELAERLKALFPPLKILFISGHSDFAFARNAIKLEAYDYLLKPIEDEELEEALKKIVDKINQERLIHAKNREILKQVDEIKPIIKEKILSDILYGTLDNDNPLEKAANYGLDIVKGKYSLLLAEIDNYKSLAADGTGRLEKTVADAADMAFPQAEEYSRQFVRIDSSKFAFILSFARLSEEAAINRAVRAFAERLISGFRDEKGLSITVSMASPVNRLGDICKAYSLCYEILSQKMFLGKGKVLSQLKKQGEQPPGEADLFNVNRELMSGLSSRDTHKINHYIDYIFDALANSRITSSVHIQSYCINTISHLQLALLEMNESIENIFGPGTVLWDRLSYFETIPEIKNSMKNIFRTVVEYLDQKSNNRSRKIIGQVLKYVEENYSKEITLKEIASELFYSPNHLGCIFKEETGQTFSEYLNEHRMKRAGQLLKDPTVKTYEVAHLVGYNNANPFIKQFKQYYGLTPREFRDR